MACAPHYCTNNKVRGCGGHRAPNSSASPVVAAPTAGTKITTAKIEELRAAIQTEINAYRVHENYAAVATSVAATPAVGTAIEESRDLNTKNQGLNAIGGAGSPATIYEGSTDFSSDGSGWDPAWSYDYAATNLFSPLTNYTELTGNKITVTNYNELLTRYNYLKSDCICNSDCNCNAVCACHGNCGCNYSDLRLKMEICYC